MIDRKKLPIFSLHAAGQGDMLEQFMQGLMFDDCRYLKQDARDFALVVLTDNGMHRALISCKNDDMKNFALKRARNHIAEIIGL